MQIRGKMRFRTAGVRNNLAKGFKRGGDKSSMALLKETKNLGGVFQDVEPPRLTSLLRKSSTTTKPIRCVRFSTVVLRDAELRDQNLSLNKICYWDSHQRSPNALKFEDRSQEEREWQEHWAREAARRLAKKILKLKEQHKAAFFSPTEKWCVPSPSKIKLEERESCGGLRGVDAYDKQKVSEFFRVGDCSDFQVSNDSHNSQW